MRHTRIEKTTARLVPTTFWFRLLAIAVSCMLALFLFPKTANIFAAATVLLGDQAVESTPDDNIAGLAEAFQSTATASGTVSSLTVYLDTSSSATQLIAGIYASTGTHPGALLGQGILLSPVAGAWNTVTIPSVGVTSGTVYWIAILGTGGTLHFRDGGTSCSSENSSQANLSALPATWSPGPVWQNCRLSAYGSASAGVSGPVLSISPTTVSFSATQGSGTNPAPASVNVSNTGGGTLTFTASSDSPSWLSVTPSGGTAPQSLQISAALGSLVAGTYTGHITVTAIGAQGSPATITVTFTVAPAAPVLTVSPTTVSFSATQGSGTNPAPTSVNVSNTGGGTLTFTASSDSSWLSVTPGSGTAPQSLQLSAALGSLVAGTYTGHITVTASGAQGSPATITVTFTVAPAAPVLTVSPTTVSFSATQGSGTNPAPTSVNVSNTGGGTLTFTASSDSSWLSVTPGSGTAPQSLQLSAALGSLVAGTYTGHITVTASGAQGSPATITVTFTVSSAPVPTLTSLSPSSAIAGGPGFTLTVNGASFVLGDTIQWNGTSLPTTFVSATQLTAPEAASQIANSGTIPVTVQTPTGSNSNSLAFTINATQPAIIGDQTVETRSDSAAAGSAKAFQATASVTGSAGSLVVYVDNGSASTQLIAGIYSNSGGRPSTLLGQGSVTALQVGGWNTVAISSSNVTAGGAYWIAIMGTGGTLRFRDGSGCTSVNSSQTNQTSLRRSWSSGSISSSCPLSAYGLAGATFTISGTITPVGGGAGATVALSGAASASTTANGSGAYSFTGLANGIYTVTPSNSGYTFAPSNRPVTINGANATGINFTAAAIASTYTISGTISPITSGAGATVTLSGTAAATTTADGAGNYSFGNLANGIYVVTPTNSDIAFNPASQNVTVNGADAPGVNFTSGTQTVTWNPSVLLPANSGYVDTQSRQVVRVKATDTVYIIGLQGGAGGSSWAPMWKGSPAGNPTSFTEMDAAHRPSNNTQIEGVDCRLQDNTTIIQCAYQDDSNHAEKYIQFDTSTDTWGTPETVGTFTSYLQQRYHSKNSLCLDSAGTAWITWGGSPSRDSLHLSHRIAANTYSTETVTSTQVYRATAAWDANGNLNIAYMNYSTFAILYKQRTSGGTYSSEETVASAVDPAYGEDNGPSIVFDPANGNVVVDYLTSTAQGKSNGSTTYAPNAKERTGTNAWVNIFNVPQTTGGHSPAAYVDYQGSFYQFMGHGNTDPSQAVVAQYNGSSWTGYTDIVANQGATVMDCSANIRYDLLNPSNPSDIDFVGCIENYNTNTAQLVYAHGSIAATDALARPKLSHGLRAFEADAIARETQYSHTTDSAGSLTRRSASSEKSTSGNKAIQNRTAEQIDENSQIHSATGVGGGN